MEDYRQILEATASLKASNDRLLALIHEIYEKRYLTLKRIYVESQEFSFEGRLTDPAAAKFEELNRLLQKQRESCKSTAAAEWRIYRLCRDDPEAAMPISFALKEICQQAAEELDDFQLRFCEMMEPLQKICGGMKEYRFLHEAAACHVGIIRNLIELYTKIQSEQYLNAPDSDRTEYNFAEWEIDPRPAARPPMSPAPAAARPPMSPAPAAAPKPENAVSGRLPKLDKVQFSALAPRTFVKGQYTMIEVLMYEDNFRAVVDEILADIGKKAQETKSGTFRVEKDARVSVVLSSPDLTIGDDTEERVWQGEYARFSFAIELPAGYRKNQILFYAEVFINGVPATRLKFIAKCRALRKQKMEVVRQDIRSAFVSYASQDRNRVAAIVQGMKKIRPDMDIFFDVESLRSGTDWEETLWSEINRRDVLFLCWSRSAKESQWVDAEWRYALAHKGAESIEPIPIDPPEVCPPPRELAKKHFNDMLLYVINSDQDAMKRIYQPQ